MPKVAMVVDDSSMVRQMVSATLTKAGFQILEGVDGRDALNKLAASPPVSLFMTDLNMPNMDGISFIKSVRSNAAYRSTPILMLTTESSDAKKGEAKAAGATGWLTKPFNPDQVLQVVAKVVR